MFIKDLFQACESPLKGSTGKYHCHSQDFLVRPSLAMLVNLNLILSLFLGLILDVQSTAESVSKEIVGPCVSKPPFFSGARAVLEFYRANWLLRECLSCSRRALWFE